MLERLPILVMARRSFFIKKLQSPWLIYVLLVAIVSLLLLWRYPNNVTHPNFYAEDGSVFLQNVLDHGWLHAAFQSFNGYFIVGLYGIEAIGWVLNNLFGHAGLLSLPQYFALASILCMAAVIALPYLVFRKTYSTPVRLSMVTFGALVPLPQSIHIVIGTVGNQKWVFMYLAFLLVCYWVLNYQFMRLRTAFFLCVTLLICAYTNTTTYLLFPVLFSPYIFEIIARKHTRNFRGYLGELIRQPLFLCLVFTCFLLLPQVLYIHLHGIPKISGYLDTPYQSDRTVELFINRTYLFGITHLFNKYLSDAIVISLFLIFITVGFATLQRRERQLFLISLYATGVASLLFVANRPGVTAFFNGYARNGSGPDQFFYAQSLIMYPIIVLILFRLKARLRQPLLGNGIAVLGVSFVVCCGLASNALFGQAWRNASPFENTAATFIDTALSSCSTQHTPSITLPLYPYGTSQFSLRTARKQVCTNPLAKYQLSSTHTLLQPNNTPFPVTGRHAFFQTFVATESNLNGVRLLISDYGNNHRHGTYTFHLYTADCRTEVRTTNIPTILLDNSNYNIRFKPIHGSARNTYCFSVEPPLNSTYNWIAVQISKPNSYSDGELRLGAHISDSDMVFTPLFTQAKQ